MPFLPDASPNNLRAFRFFGILAIVGGILVAIFSDRLMGAMIACFGILFTAMSAVMLPTPTTERWQRVLLVGGTLAGIIGWVLALIKVL